MHPETNGSLLTIRLIHAFLTDPSWTESIGDTAAEQW